MFCVDVSAIIRLLYNFMCLNHITRRHIITAANRHSTPIRSTCTSRMWPNHCGWDECECGSYFLYFAENYRITSIFDHFSRLMYNFTIKCFTLSILWKMWCDRESVCVCGINSNSSGWQQQQTLTMWHHSKPNVFIIFNEHVLNMVFGVWQPVAYATPHLRFYQMMAHKSPVFATSHSRHDMATMQLSQRKTIQMRFACETCLYRCVCECGKLFAWLPSYNHF